MRRNLSGLYIHEQFEGEDKEHPTCFEDCKRETQEKYLETLNEKEVKELTIKLADVLHQIGKKFEMVSG